MPIKPVYVQRRMMELGRVRLGEKGPKGEPRRLNTFRFTSASQALLEAVAAKHGGTVSAWTDAPDEGYFEVTTEATSLDIILPPVYSAEDGEPTTAYSQWFELWSGGGCQRRCDGETESLSGKECLCNPDERDCKVTTRVSFILPDIPGLGVWRLDSHGWNAAVELPGTLEVLVLAASEHKFIPAVLRVEQRNKKIPGEGTRRFNVPVIDLPGVTVNQLAAGEAPLALNAPAAPPRRGERPALPTAEPPAEPATFQNDVETPGWGEQPVTPTYGGAAGSEGEPSGSPATRTRAEANAAPPTGEASSPSDDISRLTDTLLSLLNELGARDPGKAITANAKEHANAPDRHKAWLLGQIERARTARDAQLAHEQQQLAETR